MKIQVLGSAAGGGFPQWNCNCFNCDGVRRGSIDARPRTQSSIAITENAEDWVLVNASPDLLAQIKSHPALQSHLGVKFYNAFNEQILLYGKMAPSGAGTPYRASRSPSARISRRARLSGLCSGAR